MEVYNIPQHGHADTYLIQGTESRPHLASPSVEQFETMYSAGAPEFALQQGMYYPSATNYGYFYTGMESPNDWDDHQRVFGLDGQEIQYAGAQTENSPYLYYTPSYGYPESQYNPYNPYIPGALIGLDGSYIGSQQYYTVPSYDTTSSAPSYFPMVVQSRPDIPPNSTAEPFLDASASSIAYRNDISSLKQNMSSTSAAFTRNPSRVTADLKKSFTMVSGGSKVNVGLNRQPYANSSVSSNVFTSAAASNAFQGRGTQIVDNLSHGKVWSNRNQLKVAPIANGLSSFGSSAHRKTLMDKVQTKVNAGSGSPDVSFEQNRGLRTSTPLKQLPVKAYTSMAGESNSEGSIVIHKDMYNKNDFPLDYVNAKFFVIKSYSEDDVHKSIKYNVWSSTPNGNKKLYIAYDDAQRIAAGESKSCPIFLFFSVNASGQFCGVAEMTGAVDFHKDMDFWQQDKWCGSFPVMWHFIKDVPNPNFRHIILENNENKPVTNSRDTQEIRYKKGMEMLKIFKHYTSKTCILDDFMYYDNRENLLKQEKARFLNKSYENPFILPHIEPPRKLSGVLNLPLNKDAQLQKDNDDRNAKIVAISTEQILVNKEAAIANESIATENKVEKDIGLLKIGSLSINPKKSNINPVGNGAPAPITSPAHASETVSAKPVEVVTVGSMPVKVNGFANSVGSLIVGTIPLDPKALNLNEAV